MNLHKKLNVLKQALLKEKFGNWQLLSSHTWDFWCKDRDLKSKDQTNSSIESLKVENYNKK